MNDSMATKHLNTDLPNSLPGPRYPMSSAFWMSTSVNHNVAFWRPGRRGCGGGYARESAESRPWPMGKCRFLLSRPNKWAWLPTVSLLLDVLRGGAWQPGAHLFLILRGQASTSPPHHVYLHHGPDSPQPALRLATCGCPLYHLPEEGRQQSLS